MRVSLRSVSDVVRLILDEIWHLASSCAGDHGDAVDQNKCGARPIPLLRTQCAYSESP